MTFQCNTIKFQKKNNYIITVNTRKNNEQP